METHVQQHLDNLIHDLRWGATAEQRCRAASNLRAFGSRAVSPLCCGLYDSDPLVRCTVIQSLGALNDARAVEPLARMLRDVVVPVRIAAVESLTYFNLPRAHKALCYALKDSHDAVRTAAAKALGEVGSIETITPLLQALRDCLVKREERGKFAYAILIFPFLVAFVLWGRESPSIWLLTIVSVSVLSALAQAYQKRHAQSEVCQAIADALTRIAERIPSPEVRSALPDLQAVANDVLFRNAETRATARRAAQRIEMLTEPLKNLPLPASAPAPDSATLPRAADATAPDVHTLPRLTEQ